MIGVSRSVLLTEARNILETPLGELGYEFDPSNRDGWGRFEFVKKPQQPTELFYIIEFRPSGFLPDDDFFDMAVNLHSRTKRNERGPKIEGGPEQIWALPLNPHLWGGAWTRSLYDTLWHFISAEELRNAYEDILGKLKKYAIPFLEDPKSTFSSGMGLSEV